jgi:hypothetical protein
MAFDPVYDRQIGSHCPAVHAQNGQVSRASFHFCDVWLPCHGTP